jgi:hypothetical protein
VAYLSSREHADVQMVGSISASEIYASWFKASEHYSCPTLAPMWLSAWCVSFVSFAVSGPELPSGDSRRRADETSQCAVTTTHEACSLCSLWCAFSIRCTIHRACGASSSSASPEFVHTNSNAPFPE